MPTWVKVLGALLLLGVALLLIAHLAGRMALHD